MSINIFGLIGLIIGVTNISIGLLVYMYDWKKLTSKLWLFFAFSVSIWGFGSYFISITKNPTEALCLWRATHFGILLIPFSLALFTHAFLDKRLNKVLPISLVFVLFFALANTTDYFISSTRLVFNSFYYDGPPTFLYTVFVVLFFLTFLYILFISARAYILTKDSLKKRQILFFIIASAIGSLGGGTSFLPVYGINIYPYLNAFIILFPLIIGYAILRYKLFDLRVIITDLLVFLIWILGILRILLLTNRTDFYANIGFSIILFFVGLLLIKSVRQEVKAREQLKELDEMKTQFISLATHHISTPLTAVNGYISILNEEYKDLLPKAGQEILHSAQVSTEKVITITRDFLNAVQLEKNEQEYIFAQVSIVDLLTEIKVEYKPLFKENGIQLIYKNDAITELYVTADRNKLKQAFSNILFNSNKYMSEGEIMIHSRMVGKKIVTTVTDTAQRNIPKTSQKLRQKFTQKGSDFEANLIGSSLGLYVAKQIIEKHKGSLSIENNELQTEFRIIL